MINLISAPDVPNAAQGVFAGEDADGQSGAGVDDVRGAAPPAPDLFAALLGFASSGKAGSSVLGLDVSADPAVASMGDSDTKSDDSADSDVNAALACQAAALLAGTGVPVQVGAAGSLRSESATIQDAELVSADVTSVAKPASTDTTANGPADYANVVETDAAASSQLPSAQSDGSTESTIQTDVSASSRVAVPTTDEMTVATAAVSGAVDVPVDSRIDDGRIRMRQAQSATAPTATTPRSAASGQNTQLGAADLAWTMSQPVQRIASDGMSMDWDSLLAANGVLVDQSGDDTKSTTEPVMATATPTPGAVQTDSTDASTATAETGSDAVPDLHQRVIDQLVKDVQLHKLQDGTDLTVKLQPRELGTLTIRLVSDAQGVTSQIEASNPQTKSLLQAHMPMLMDSLSNAGVKVDSVSVTSMLDFGGWGNGLTQGGQSHQQDSGTRHGQSFGNLNFVGLADQQSVTYGSRESAAYSWLA